MTNMLMPSSMSCTRMHFALARPPMSCIPLALMYFDMHNQPHSQASSDSFLHGCEMKSRHRGLGKRLMYMYVRSFQGSSYVLVHQSSLVCCMDTVEHVNIYMYV